MFTEVESPFIDETDLFVDTKYSPNVFSSITDSLLGHGSSAISYFSAIETFIVWGTETIFVTYTPKRHLLVVNQGEQARNKRSHSHQRSHK